MLPKASLTNLSWSQGSAVYYFGRDIERFNLSVNRGGVKEPIVSLTVVPSFVAVAVG